MSEAARPSKKPKTDHFDAEWVEDLFYFHYVFCEVHLSDLSNYHRYSDKGECWEALSNCS